MQRGHQDGERTWEEKEKECRSPNAALTTLDPTWAKRGETLPEGAKPCWARKGAPGCADRPDASGLPFPSSGDNNSQSFFLPVCCGVLGTQH